MPPRAMKLWRAPAGASLALKDSVRSKASLASGLASMQSSRVDKHNPNKRQMSVLTGLTSLSDPSFHLDADFVKTLRKPEQFFGELCDEVKQELRGIPSVKGCEKLRQLLTSQERQNYQETVITNMAFSKPIAANFSKSAFGLPLMGSAIYAHLWAGLTNYIMQKKGLDAATASHEELRTHVHHCTYYRSPLMVEDLKLLGYSSDNIQEAVAKAFYLQYWSGNHADDPMVFNPMLRAFFPNIKHVLTSAVDLGREHEWQSAKLFALGNEQRPQPVTVLNTGDTGGFTDGAMSALQHMMEANERGIPMPLIFMVNANNSAISTRLSHSGDALTDSTEGVRRIVRRFDLWGDLLSPGFVEEAADTAAGVEMMRKAVDQVLETGKPTYVVCHFPYRPVGHASDGSPASDDLLMSQFNLFRDVLVKQLCDAADAGTSGADIARSLEETEQSVEDKVKYAMSGNNLITRPQIRELSVPGSTEIDQDPGHILDIPTGYLVGKGVRAFAGMGTDIYAKVLDKTFTELDAAGREVRYIHQENHKKVTHDTRCGVYGELNGISDHHLESKFVSFLPNEAQAAQVAAGYASSLAPGNVVFCKGPHTPFNEHAGDLLKFAGFRNVRQKAGMIYIIDGSNLAAREKETITTPDGQTVERDLVIARVGQHHNSPYYSQYAADANTVACVPMDMNMFAAMMPAMVKLQSLGRVVINFLPTPQFGSLHPALPKGVLSEERGLTQNDIWRASFEGKTPVNGRELVVVSWGPDSKWIAKSLAEEGLKATQLILNYMQPANSLISALADIAQKGTLVEVVCVDPNPDAMLLAPVMTVVKERLNYPDNMIFSDCFVRPTYVPHGAGEYLLAAKDFLRTLRRRGILAGGDSSDHQRSVQRVSTPAPSGGMAATSATGAVPSSTGDEIVTAPMDGEGVVVTYRVKVGDNVNEDDVIAEIESDKATVEVAASASGTIGELFVQGGEEMDVTMDTKICSIVVGNQAPTEVKASATSAANEQVDAGDQEVVPLSRVQLAMVDQMTVKAGDTKTYTVGEFVNFEAVLAQCKALGVSPNTYLVKALADTVKNTDVNKKLSADKRSLRSLQKSVDVGVAVEVGGHLRVAVVRDAANKSANQINADIKGFVESGSRLAPEDQDLSNVCFVVSSLGKQATERVDATLPRGTTGILAVGRAVEKRSYLVFTLCHATLTGSDGANLLFNVIRRAEEGQ